MMVILFCGFIVITRMWLSLADHRHTPLGIVREPGASEAAPPHLRQLAPPSTSKQQGSLTPLKSPLHLTTIVTEYLI